ncbi:MAG: phosphoadenylyl-sulfate reductase [Alphaproteobacteria bacterium]|nr:phosphoadenylyl-sulfate reductase [Alphaproteobacteria bacterium]
MSTPTLASGAGPQQAQSLAAILTTTEALTDRIQAIRNAVDGRIVFSTSLGIEDQVILHAIADTGVDVEVLTLDTGRHFPETLETIRDSELRYGLKIHVVAPEKDSVDTLVARDGVFGFRNAVENRIACCDVRKVRPLNRALHGASGWITGMRREQSQGRGATEFASFDDTRQLIKANPLADWSLDRVEAFVKDNNVPINALHARGYPSIGCQPCTRAIEPGEDIRAGRWWWENDDGKECGLHNRPATVTTKEGAAS